MARRFYEDDTGPWYKPSSWSKRVWVILGIAVVVIIAIVVPIAVVVPRNNSSKSGSSSYPDYSQLNYTLKDTCKSCMQGGVVHGSTRHLGTNSPAQTLAPASSTTLTTTLVLIPLPASCTMCPRRRLRSLYVPPSTLDIHPMLPGTIPAHTART